MQEDIDKIVKELSSKQILKVYYIKDSKIQIFVGTFLPISDNLKGTDKKKFIILQNIWSDMDKTNHLVSKKIYYEDIQKIELLTPKIVYEKKN